MKNIRLAFIFFCFVVVYSPYSFCQDAEKIFLSGTGATDTKTWDFYCSDGMNSNIWTTIEVPSCWEQQGFGAYNYGHDNFEERTNETGTYRYSFVAENSWNSKEVRIVFEGVMTDATVKINNKNVGPTHQGAFYQFDFDISALLDYGNINTLEVSVKKHSENESVNQAERKADYWIFGGIFRPVYLEVKPKENIRRVAIHAKANGTFEADVFITENYQSDLIETSIQTLTGETIESISTKPEGNPTRIYAKLGAIQPWNPENPNLYQAVFKLKSNGEIIYEHKERFGFRTVEVRANDGIYINGVRIKFKGVDRHTFHPEYGRTSSKDLSTEAVKLMKEMNMNAVRMSHYPPDKHFLDVCDSLGLMVMNELAGWQKPAYDDKIGRKLLAEMVIRDVNHPSIVLWNNGNEGGWNYSYDDDFAKYDIQKREVLHPWEDFRKTNTLHYVSYDYLALDGYSKRKIFLPTELLHGLYDGGHGAGLEDYWLRLWNHPLAAGAFLWVFADEAIARTDKNGILDSDGNHAPDGILGPFMEKEGSFFTIKKIWSPIYFEKRYITPEFNGIFNIENRYHFTNLNQCQFTVEWIKYVDDNNDISSKVIYSEDLRIDLEPTQKGRLKISMPTSWREAHVLYIRAKDPEGNTISNWSYPVQTPAKVAEQMIVDREKKDVVLTENDEQYNVAVGKMALTFDKLKGLLTMVKNGSETISLNNGPAFVSKEKGIERITAEKNGDGSVSIHIVYKDHQDSASWRIQKNGYVELKVAYEPAPNAPYAGISFSFPEENITGMKWMGNGPYRVWKNRMEGINFGVWEKNYNNTITGHSSFTYPEFKGYHSETYWVQIFENNGNNFTVYLKSDDIFLKMLTPDQAEDPRATHVDFPKGDISFLHGINSIGTKFKKTDSLGPQSSSNHYFNANKIFGKKLRMELVFDFNK